MLLIEMLLVVQEVALPDWWLPYNTPHDIISTLHKLFPAYMNGCRCIAGAFYVDERADRVKLLEEVQESTKDLCLKVDVVLKSYENIYLLDNDDNSSNSNVDDNGLIQNTYDGNNNNNNIGFMQKTLFNIENKIISSSTSNNAKHKENMKNFDSTIALINDPYKLASQQNKTEEKDANELSKFEIFRNFCIYLLVRFLFVKKSK
jgi:hypothetical protein